MRVFLFFPLMGLFIQSFAETTYRVSDIPKELIENAFIVIRDKEMKFIISDIDKAVLEVKVVMTILHDEGIDDSRITLEYSKFCKILDLDCSIYDKEGKKIRIPTTNEIKDLSAISGYSIYEDNRTKYFDPQQKSPPFTVAYTYKISFNGLFYYPYWQIYEDYYVSTEKTRFEVVVPNNLKFRYYSRNISVNPEITNNGKQTSYVWDTSMIKAIVNEPFSRHLTDYTPIVYTAPVDFKISSYEGNLETWQNFGKWIELLNQGKDNLPEDTKTEILELTKYCKNDYEKAKIVYEYMQNRTRYVSIQIGIGGWQPFEAETVDKLGYGDCKALTNYTRSLLSAVGIKSYYTLVGAGSDTPDLNDEFPSSQFNHAFLFIPLSPDTIWLECTNQNLPFGYIGSFTDDRDVLVIEGDSSKIVHTKVYSTNENIKSNNANVDIMPDGSCKASTTTRYKGVYYDDIYYNFQSDDEKRKDLINKDLQIPDFELVKVVYEEIKVRTPEIKEELVINLVNYCKPIGDRLILDLNLMNHIQTIPRQAENRLSDLLIRRSKVEIDTIIYHIPDIYSVKSIPAEMSQNSEFGSYYSKVELKEDSIIYIRKYEILKGVYPKEKYNELIDFYRNNQQYDNVKILLTKK